MKMKAEICPSWGLEWLSKTFSHHYNHALASHLYLFLLMQSDIIENLSFFAGHIHHVQLMPDYLVIYVFPLPDVKHAPYLLLVQALATRASFLPSPSQRRSCKDEVHLSSLSLLLRLQSFASHRFAHSCAHKYSANGGSTEQLCGKINRRKSRWIRFLLA